MRINTGDFGTQVAPLAPPPRVGPDSFVTPGVQELGAAGLRIGAEIAQGEAQTAHEEYTKTHQARLQAEREAKLVAAEARKVEASQLHGNAQVALYKEADRIRLGIAQGTIGKEEAPKLWEDAAQSIVKEHVKLVDKSSAELLKISLINDIGHRAREVNHSVIARGQLEIATSVDAYEETMQRLAMSDRRTAIDQFNVMADTQGPLAGLNPEQIGKRKQAFAERVTFTLAARHLDEAKGALDAKAVKASMEVLRSDAFPELDPEKRRMLLSHGQEALNHIQRAAEHARDRRVAQVGRQIDAMQMLTMQGFPPTPEQLAPLVAASKGTEYAPVAQSMLGTVEFVNRTKNFSPQQWEAQLLDLERAVREQPTPGLKKYLDTGRHLYAETMKRVKDDPQAYIAGQGISPGWKPMDWSNLANPGKHEAFADQLSARYDTALAAQRQWGSPVQVLTKQEAATAATYLSAGTTAMKLTMLSSLREKVRDPGAWSSLMGQISPDSPVTAVAGSILAKNRQVTVENRMFSANVQQSTTEIAATMIEGEALINRSKSVKAGDGMPAQHGLFVPAEEKLREAFKQHVGKAFQADPHGADVAFQAVRAWYTGSAARDGDINSKDGGINTERLKRSLRAVVGEVADYNGRGQVLLPLGMDEGTFSDTVRKRFPDALKGAGLPETVAGQLSAFGLMQAGDGRYVVLSGGRPLVGKNGRELEINVLEPQAMQELSARRRRGIVGPMDVPQ